MSAMSWKNYFIYQTDYQHWANEILFASLDHLDDTSRHSAQGLFFDNIHHTVDHMLVVSRNWMWRLKQDNQSIGYGTVLHPEWKELKTALRRDMRDMQRWLESQPEPFFETCLTYTSANNQHRDNWVRDILTHMMSHMVHHRGQVSAVATRLGAPVPEMDYLFYKREMDEHVAHIQHTPGH